MNICEKHGPSLCTKNLWRRAGARIWRRIGGAFSLYCPRDPSQFPGVTGTGWDVPGIGSRPGDRRARRIVRNLIGTGWDARPTDQVPGVTGTGWDRHPRPGDRGP